MSKVKVVAVGVLSAAVFMYIYNHSAAVRKALGGAA